MLPRLTTSTLVQFDPRNILVIHFGQLGDVVLGLPAFRAIRQRFPNARITVAVGKPANEVVAMSGYADEIFEVDRVSLRDGNKLISIARIVKFVMRVRQEKFDFVIDLHSLSETNLLGYLSGAPHRLYSRRPGRSIDFLANFKPRPPLEEKSRHITDRYLDLLKSLDIQNASRVPVIKTSPAGDFAVAALLKKEKAESGELLVGLFPGAGNVSRKWPLEHFAQLADHLIRNDRVRVVVFAGPEERAEVPRMRTLFPPNTIFLDRLTISQLVSAQARLTVLISNDTGPAHLAAAVGAPVIVILDCPTPHSFVPQGDQHRLICGADITKITVDEVYQAAHELLALSRTDSLIYSDHR
jgi:ADP-heptose:LPS heptosyltransferase